MPFANASGIQATHFYSYVAGISGYVALGDFYKGQLNNYGINGSKIYVPNASENSGFPASGTISYSNMTGMYGRRSEDFTITVANGTVSSTLGQRGYFDGTFAYGSIESDKTYNNGSGQTITIYGAYQQANASVFEIMIGNSAATSNVLAIDANSNLCIHQISIVDSNQGEVIIDAPNWSGSGGMSGKAWYTISTTYANNLFTAGNSYTLRIIWIE